MVINITGQALINLKSVADELKDEIADIIACFIEHKHKGSEVTRELFKNLYQGIYDTFNQAVKAISKNDEQAAELVISRKSELKSYVDTILSRKSTHLGSKKEDDLKLARMEISLLQSIHRLYFFSRNTARLVLPEEISS